MTDHDSLPVAIVGAGPAGAALGSLLAAAGRDTLLFHDPRTPDKHCGGGLPARTLDAFPWMGGLTAPRREIRCITLIAPSGNSSDIPLSRPVSVFSRPALDHALRERALKAGARLIPERVRFVERIGRGWIIRTAGSEHRASFLVGADGVTGLVRRTVARPFAPPALSLCAGYYFEPPDRNRITIGYMMQRATYAWIFPGPSGASAGMVAPLAGSDCNKLRAWLRLWLAQHFPGYRFDFSCPYAALVPTYHRGNGEPCGNGWALVGDAAGVAEPATREGIHFSLASSGLLAPALLMGRPERYGEMLATYLSTEHTMALWFRRLFFSPFFTERAMRSITRSPSFSHAVQHFFSGPLDYGNLLRRSILPYTRH